MQSKKLKWIRGNPEELFSSCLWPGALLLPSARQNCTSCPQNEVPSAPRWKNQLHAMELLMGSGSGSVGQVGFPKMQ